MKNKLLVVLGTLCIIPMTFVMYVTSGFFNK